MPRTRPSVARTSRSSSRTAPKRAAQKGSAKSTVTAKHAVKNAKPAVAKAAKPAARTPKIGGKAVPFTGSPIAARAPLALPRRSGTTTEARPALLPGSASREECLKRYLPLVRFVVERVAAGLPHYVDHEDLNSAGVLGLLHAYDKFDATKGTKFETYAVWRIKGAVLDQLRSYDWASRSTRRLGREADACARALDQRLGRTATDREISRAMGIPLEDYHRLMDRVRGSVLLSLDETRESEEGDSLGLGDVLEDPNAPDLLARIEEEETKGLLRATLNRLPEQERIVVALYYYEHMTLREIGEALGISESRVSQVHTRAVERLRGRVERALAS
jgi:RNA polymerase sigma factor for flagellar operon FliA